MFVHFWPGRAGIDQAVFVLALASVAVMGCGHALEDAATRGDIQEVQRLAGKGASQSELDEALLDAAYSGKREVVSYLLEHGANPNYRSSTRDPAIFAVSKPAQTEVGAALLDHGASIDARSFRLNTPLLEMIDSPLRKSAADQLAIVKFLLGRGAAIGATNVSGVTVFHAAAKYPTPDILTALCARGQSGVIGVREAGKARLVKAGPDDGLVLLGRGPGQVGLGGSEDFTWKDLDPADDALAREALGLGAEDPFPSVGRVWLQTVVLSPGHHVLHLRINSDVQMSTSSMAYSWVQGDAPLDVQPRSVTIVDASVDYQARVPRFNLVRIDGCGGGATTP